MNAANLNHLWGKLIIEELIRSCVNLFIVAPGSRSTPLAMAVAENEAAKSVVHFDERGTGYYAVGYAQATGNPAVVICTSGTAVANILPSIVEASHAHLPLIVLTADRPPELQDAGAPQTINQTGIFRPFVRWECDLPTPAEEISPRYLLTTIDQAIARALSAPSGPVHINCRFREPLAPVGVQKSFADYLAPVVNWLGGVQPLTKYVISESPSAFTSLEQIVTNAKAGVIVAGRIPAFIDPAPILKLAQRWSWPVIADISSQIRTSGIRSDELVAHSDLVLRCDKIAGSAPSDLVLQFGAPPLSKSLLAWIDRAEQYVVIDPGVNRLDPQHHATMRISAAVSLAATTLTSLKSVSVSRLLKPLQTLSQIASAEIDWLRTEFREVMTELLIADEILRAAEYERALYLGTSMPIRLADVMASNSGSRLRIGANRGVNGIDGTIAAAIGFSNGANLPGTVLLGDLALLHDLNSLALLAQSNQPVIVVVTNNDGGGIFEFLPVAQVEQHFERFFAAPHGRRFLAAAEMFGLKHYHPKSVRDFATTYHHAIRAGKSALIEVTSDRKQAVARFRELTKRVEESALRRSPEIVNSR